MKPWEEFQKKETKTVDVFKKALKENIEKLKKQN